VVEDQYREAEAEVEVLNQEVGEEEEDRYQEVGVVVVESTSM